MNLSDVKPVSLRAAMALNSVKTEGLGLEIGGIVEEIYDVNLLPNVIRPMALGFRNDEIRFTIKPEALTEPTGAIN